MRGVPRGFKINTGARLAAAKGVTAYRNLTRVWNSGHEAFDPSHVGTSVSYVAVIIYLGGTSAQKKRHVRDGGESKRYGEGKQPKTKKQTKRSQTRAKRGETNTPGPRATFTQNTITGTGGKKELGQRGPPTSGTTPNGKGQKGSAVSRRQGGGNQRKRRAREKKRTQTHKGKDPRSQQGRKYDQ